MRARCRGFTLVELLVTLALVGIAASVILPLASVVETRASETELKRSLRTIRHALDAYKQAVDAGQIDRTTGASGYPPDLRTLTQGVPMSAAFGMGRRPVIFLRAIPRDPFWEDPSTPAEQTWRIRSYAGAAGSWNDKSDVFDISSMSEKTALNGTAYKDW